MLRRVTMSNLESGQSYSIEPQGYPDRYIGTFVGLIPYEKSKEFKSDGFIAPLYDEGQNVAYFTHVVSVPSFKKSNLKVCGSAYDFREVTPSYVRLYEKYLREQPSRGPRPQTRGGKGKRQSSRRCAKGKRQSSRRCAKVNKK